MQAEQGSSLPTSRVWGILIGLPQPLQPLVEGEDFTGQWWYFIVWCLVALGDQERSATINHDPSFSVSRGVAYSVHAPSGNVCRTEHEASTTYSSPLPLVTAPWSFKSGCILPNFKQTAFIYSLIHLLFFWDRFLDVQVSLKPNM